MSSDKITPMTATTCTVNAVESTVILLYLLQQVYVQSPTIELTMIRCCSWQQLHIQETTIELTVIK